MKIPMLEIKNETKNKIQNDMKRFSLGARAHFSCGSILILGGASWDKDASAAFLSLIKMLAAFLSKIKMQPRHLHPGTIQTLNFAITVHFLVITLGLIYTMRHVSRVIDASLVYIGVYVAIHTKCHASNV